jgi:short-subunit dehydrogenase
MNINIKKEKTALITGATGGIGYEFSQLFASDKINLVLVARNQEKLKQLSEQLQTDYGIKVYVIAVDLTKPAATQSLHQDIKEKGLTIDFLINNAGIGNYGLFVNADLNDLTNMLALNVIALVQLTRFFLPEMIQQGGGRIVNVASIAAFQPGGPKEAAYFASKSFVLAFNRALAVELKGTAVTSTAFCPGPLKTGFAEQGGLVTTRLYRYLAGDIHKQVAKAYQGMLKGKSIVVAGLINKILAFSGELPPRSIALSVNKFLLNK